MNKILSLLVGLMLSAITAFSAEVKFIQVDGLKYNPYDEASVKSFDRMIADINNIKNSDFVIFSGDNVAKSDEYYLKEFLKKTKKINSPIYVALGNKDVKKRKGLSKTQYVKVYNKNVHFQTKMKEPNYLFIKYRIVFIILDGSKEFLSTQNGYYREDTLKWLNNKLKKYSNKNVVIIQHFPVIPPKFRDGYATYRSEDYLKVIENKTNVKAIISGLYNTNAEQNVNGVLHISTESAPKFRMINIIDTETQNPVFWSEIME
jgi:predicted phosphodiesterase